MMILFASIVFLVLLILLKQSFEQLHSIIVIIFFFVILQFIFRTQLYPLWQQLATLFQSVPYSKGLLYTALLFLSKDLFCALLKQMEYEAYVSLVTLSIRLTVIVYWVNELATPFQTFVQLLERLS
ncbi:pyruvate formate-lyase [Solibacillus sp. FSL R7-0668]|uniref:pyruvate formate-lyase n=1 Tax=Solibacillus sp. FSL R7-0668 TaxID=2921688 RepID=UPI0030FC0088